MRLFQNRSFALQTRGVIVAVMCAVLSMTAIAQDIAQNTAQGSITVNGKKTEFRHAYAVTRSSQRDKKPETILVISDKPLATNAVADDTERMVAQTRDDLKLIEIKFDDGKTVVGTNFEVAPLVVSVFSTEFKMNIESFTDKVLKGRFNSVSDHKMRDNTYSFDVKFNAAMMVPPVPAASGKLAWDTPQGKVLAAYLRACIAGDKAAIKRLVIAEVRSELDGPKAAATMKFLQADSADPKTAEFDSLTVNGNIAKAKITVRRKSSTETTGFELRKVGEVWLVAP